MNEFLLIITIEALWVALGCFVFGKVDRDMFLYHWCNEKKIRFIVVLNLWPWFAWKCKKAHV